MRAWMLAAAGLLLGTAGAGAQESARRVTPEVRPYVGVYLPAGAMRDQFKAATTLGAQGALELSRNLHLLANGSWTHGHTKLAVTNDVTYVWQYDVGVEANVARPLGGGWLFRPFAGLGAGGRTYDYRASGVASRSCTAGYGALGTELQTGGVAVRVEGRDYLSCYRAPTATASHTRNDVGLALGMAYHLR